MVQYPIFLCIHAVANELYDIFVMDLHKALNHPSKPRITNSWGAKFLHNNDLSILVDSLQINLASLSYYTDFQTRGVIFRSMD
jgi:hypothetical protein